MDFPDNFNQMNPAERGRFLTQGAKPGAVAKYKEWITKNRNILDKFIDLAYQMKRTNRTRYSHQTIIEKMRWDYDIVTKGDTFKINNDFTSLLVRHFIAYHPQFKDFFELRVLGAKGYHQGTYNPGEEEL